MDNSKYLRAIVMDLHGDKPIGRGPYRNIRNIQRWIDRYIAAMKKQFPNATHINFYYENKKFFFQHRFPVEREKKLPVKRKRTQQKGQMLGFPLEVLAQWDP